MTANKIILREQYNRMSKNFMTPDIISYQITGDCRVVELSRGDDFDGNKIWGVSEFDSDLQTTRRGELFFKYQQARKLYKDLITKPLPEAIEELNAIQ